MRIRLYDISCGDMSKLLFSPHRILMTEQRDDFIQVYLSGSGIIGLACGNMSEVTGTWLTQRLCY